MEFAKSTIHPLTSRSKWAKIIRGRIFNCIQLSTCTSTSIHIHSLTSSSLLFYDIVNHKLIHCIWLYRWQDAECGWDRDSAREQRSAAGLDSRTNYSYSAEYSWSICLSTHTGDQDQRICTVRGLFLVTCWSVINMRKWYKGVISTKGTIVLCKI